MERILVSISNRHGFREALNRAVSLAERIDVKVHVLLVLDETGNVSRSFLNQELERSVRGRVELLQQNSPRPGLIELFLAKGNYEEETIRFADQYRITLLVAEQADSETVGGRESLSLETMRRRLNCRVELVTPKRSK